LNRSSAPLEADEGLGFLQNELQRLKKDLQLRTGEVAWLRQQYTDSNDKILTLQDTVALLEAEKDFDVRELKKETEKKIEAMRAEANLKDQELQTELSRRQIYASRIETLKQQQVASEQLRLSSESEKQRLNADLKDMARELEDLRALRLKASLDVARETTTTPSGIAVRLPGEILGARSPLQETAQSLNDQLRTAIKSKTPAAGLTPSSSIGSGSHGRFFSTPGEGAGGGGGGGGGGGEGEGEGGGAGGGGEGIDSSVGSFSGIPTDNRKTNQLLRYKTEALSAALARESDASRRYAVALLDSDETQRRRQRLCDALLWGEGRLAILYLSSQRPASIDDIKGNFALSSEYQGILYNRASFAPSPPSRSPKRFVSTRGGLSTRSVSQGGSIAAIGSGQSGAREETSDRSLSAPIGRKSSEDIRFVSESFGNFVWGRVLELLDGKDAFSELIGILLPVSGLVGPEPPASANQVHIDAIGGPRWITRSTALLVLHLLLKYSNSLDREWQMSAANNLIEEDELAVSSSSSSSSFSSEVLSSKQGRFPKSSFIWSEDSIKIAFSMIINLLATTMSSSLLSRATGQDTIALASVQSLYGIIYQVLCFKRTSSPSFYAMEDIQNAVELFPVVDVFVLPMFKVVRDAVHMMVSSLSMAKHVVIQTAQSAFARHTKLMNEQRKSRLRTGKVITSSIGNEIEEIESCKAIAEQVHFFLVNVSSLTLFNATLQRETYSIVFGELAWAIEAFSITIEAISYYVRGRGLSYNGSGGSEDSEVMEAGEGAKVRRGRNKSSRIFHIISLLRELCQLQSSAVRAATAIAGLDNKRFCKFILECGPVSDEILASQIHAFACLPRLVAALSARIEELNELYDSLAVRRGDEEVDKANILTQYSIDVRAVVLHLTTLLKVLYHNSGLTSSILLSDLIDKSLYSTSTNPGLEHAVGEFRMPHSHFLNLQGASTDIFTALLDLRSAPRADICAGNKSLSGRNMTERIIRATCAMQSTVIRVRNDKEEGSTQSKGDVILDETMTEIQDIFSML
jgi:hypothetical protein